MDSDTEMATDASDVTRLLEQTKVSELRKPAQKVVLLEHNQTIEDGLKTLARHNILSAPLVLSPDIEEIAGGDLSPQLLGWIDIADILRCFLEFLQSGGQQVPTKMLALMNVLEKQGPEFAQKLMVTVRGVEDRGLMYQADGDNTTLMQAIRNLFLRPVDGETKVVHRLAVFEPHGEIVSVISQMDVMRFLQQHVDQLGSLADRSIDDLGMMTGKPPVLSVSPHIPTLIAYDHMVRAQVSGAPVVTDAGELIANLSISDLRALTPEHFGVLALPVAEFLAVGHHTAYIGYSVNSSQHSLHPFFASSNRAGGPQKGDIQLFTVLCTTTLHELLQKFVDNHVHRMYVVDQEEHPHVLAVITPTDIMRLVAGVW